MFSGGESPAGRRLSGPGNPVNSVAFAPDNSSVAGGSNDFNVTIWDLADPADPRLLGQPLSAPLRPVRTITYSRDGKTIIAGSDDRSIVLWDVSPMVALKANVLEYACDRTGGGLSSNEWDRFVPGIPYLNNCT